MCADTKAFGIVEEMHAVALGDTLLHVDFAVVRRVVDGVHTGSVESYRVEGCEDTDIRHLYGSRMCHAVTVNRKIVCH